MYYGSGGVAAENTSWRSVFWMAVSGYINVHYMFIVLTVDCFIYVAWIVS
jgi:hypothetical protein